MSRAEKEESRSMRACKRLHHSHEAVLRLCSGRSVAAVKSGRRAMPVNSPVSRYEGAMLTVGLICQCKRFNKLLRPMLNKVQL